VTNFEYLYILTRKTMEKIIVEEIIACKRKERENK
jgi:hypothetical protein